MTLTLAERIALCPPFEQPFRPKFGRGGRRKRARRNAREQRLDASWKPLHECYPQYFTGLRDAYSYERQQAMALSALTNFLQAFGARRG